MCSLCTHYTAIAVTPVVMHIAKSMKQITDDVKSINLSHCKLLAKQLISAQWNCVGNS